MKINRDNCEAYFLDYYEGRLSPEMVQEVLLFVELNPDLQNIFSDFEAITLIDEDTVVFEKKSSLKKNELQPTSAIHELNYEEFMVAETEGLLTEEEQNQLDIFVKINPQVAKERSLYALAHLPAEDIIVFEGKETLKQKAIPVGAITADTYETFFARELEGDLNADETLLLSEFMEYNPHLEKERRLYKHTILSSETGIVFENKNQLRHSVTPVRRIVYYALSAAASLALIMSIYFLANQNNIPQNIARQATEINTTQETIPPAGVEAHETQLAAGIEQSKTDTPTSTFPSDNTTNTSQSAILEAITDTHGKNNSEFAANNHQYIEPLQSKPAFKVSTRQYVDPQFTFIRSSQMYMNENLEFYYNLKLAEQIEYASMNTKDKNPAKTIMNAATGRAEDLFAQNRNAPEREEKKNISLWTFAELGVQTYNTFTSRDVELKLRKDDEGKVVAYGLEGGIIDFEKEVKK